ncbi:MAG: hypothetical protein GY833_12815 [Aestuariibacter sp.]|nr:hypothetical protein [Aestuariibacter sp.]|tara:strand:- start:137279 stop:137494 length:216 start_codon:yes stop_codon:yes gene_type:complete
MKREYESIQVTGSCDSGCGQPATHWFGNTSAATCAKAECIKQMEERYAEHCAEMDAQFKLEEEMRDMYGYD